MTNDERANRYEDMSAALGKAREEVKRALRLNPGPRGSMMHDEVTRLVADINRAQTMANDLAQANRK